MAVEPRRADFARIRSALTLYRVCSVITGVLLLLLCGEMIFKYGFGLELEAFGPRGLLALVPGDAVTAVNLSTGLLIAHGWFYVVYLFSGFQLWSRMRWPFMRFIIIALGGIIPLLSFFLETRIAREVKAYLAAREAETTTPMSAEAAH